MTGYRLTSPPSRTPRLTSTWVVGTLASTYLIGFCGGFLLVTVQANLADLDGPRRGIAITESNVAASSCSVLAALSVGASERFELSWRGAIILALIVFFVSVARFHGGAVPVAAPVAVGQHGAGRSLPRLFWLAAFVLFLGVAAEWCIGYWRTDFLHREAGFASATSAAAMSAYFVAMAIGRFAESRIARRFPERIVLIATFALAEIGFLVLWLSPYPAFSIVGLFITGLGIAGIYPFTVSVAMAFVPNAIDLATIRLLFCASYAICSAPFVLGIVAVAGGGIGGGVSVGAGAMRWESSPQSKRSHGGLRLR